MKKLLLLIPLIIGCEQHHEDLCNKDFQERWWLIDSEATNSMNLDYISFNLSEKGSIRIVSYERDFDKEFSWSCIEYNTHKIKGQGTTYAEKIADDEWIIDVTFHGFHISTATVTPSNWNFLYE